MNREARGKGNNFVSQKPDGKMSESGVSKCVTESQGVKKNEVQGTDQFTTLYFHILIVLSWLISIIVSTPTDNF